MLTDKQRAFLRDFYPERYQELLAIETLMRQVEAERLEMIMAQHDHEQFQAALAILMERKPASEAIQ